MNIADPRAVFRGLTYGQWAGVWMNKLFSDHPDIQYQGAKGMVFLRGNLQYAYEEDPAHPVYSTMTKESAIKILPDTAVFVPIINTKFVLENVYEGQTMNHEIPMRDTARRDTVNGGDFGARIRQDPNNTDVPLVTNLNDFYVESPLFTLTIPENSAYSQTMETPMDPGVYSCITAGFFVIICQWPPGTYRLSILGKGVGKYLTRSVYDIVVTGQPRLLKDISPPPPRVVRRRGGAPPPPPPPDPMDFVADWNDPKATKS